MIRNGLGRKNNMVFYLIGLGLNLKSISVKALEAVKKCNLVYLENYTVDFPYSMGEIEKVIEKKIKELGREKVENEEFIDSAKKQDIALLVYGNPLSATTHISLVLRAKKKNIPYKIIHSESILTAIAETGLQLYKFGKTASMPAWKESYKSNSFIEVIKENLKIKAHTLLLVDIGLSSENALEQFEQVCKKRNMNLGKIIICSQIGVDSKIYYDTLEKLKKKKIKMPFCMIIPSEMHFLEKEALEALKEK